MLSPAQLQARENKLTASRVACLMTGDTDKIMNLWRELVGDPDFIEEDLSDVWPVQLGSVTEHLNLDWFERKHGPVTRRGDVVAMSAPQDWAACTLDGWSSLHWCPVETKHTGGREGLDVLIGRYQPQMHWQMIVTGAERCALSVIMGANEPIVEFIERDADYTRELWHRAEKFMDCVRSLTPPVAMAPVSAPVNAVKTYDMTGNNKWASDAVTWITTRRAAKDFAGAEKALKSLVPADAVKCHGHGITINRNKAGSLSIRELEG